MDTELFNPMRRYKAFRPRQSSRGTKAQATPTNRATISIYNNSTGAHVLAVRHWMLNGTANGVVSTAYAAGQVGSSQGLVTALLPSEAPQAGLIASIDTTTVYPADFNIALAAAGEAEWYHEFPFGIIQPGWSLVFQAQTAAQAMTVAAVWESILIEELDWFW
jgi:hypothetical protein